MHNVQSDLDAEADIYLKSSGFLEYIMNRPIRGSDLLTESILLYIDLYERDVIQYDDVIQFALWLKYLVK